MHPPAPVHVIVAVALAYLAGSIPVAYRLSRGFGTDIFQAGDGNPGTANVFMSVSRSLGAAVFLLDALKGFTPVVLAKAIGVPDAMLPVVGAAAVAGHWNPIFLKFRGGVGLATAIGAGLALMPIAGAVGLALGVAVAAGARNTELGAGAGYTASMIASSVLKPGWSGSLGAVALALLVLIHRQWLRGHHRRHDPATTTAPKDELAHSNTQ